MSVWAYKAYESFYHYGENGVVATGVIEGTEQDVDNVARESAMDVMESYYHIMTYIEEQADYYNTTLEEIMQEGIEYEYFELNPERIGTKSISDLDEELCNMEYEDFKELYE